MKFERKEPRRGAGLIVGAALARLPGAGILRVVCAAVMLVAAGAGAAMGQAPPGPLPPKPGAKVQAPPEKPQIKVRVDLVSTPVTVRDKSGEMVMDLGQKDFRIFDNGVEQRVEDYDLGGDPISLVIVAESSSRIEALLPAVRRTGILFTETVLGQTGEAAVVAFDDDIRLELPFTRDRGRIEKAMTALRMGTSGTRLYDALGQAVSLLRERPLNRRRVIITVAEAADTGSEAKLGEVLREAQLSNVVIYSATLSSTAAMLRAKPKQTGPTPIGPEGTFPLPGRAGTPQTPTTEQQQRTRLDLMALLIWLVSQAANAVGDSSLDLATMGTGGLNVTTFKDASIEKAISAIGAELHAQYTLTYRPSDTDPVGYHEIKVQVTRPGVTVRARPGYYIAP
ncbi:MAG: VWA domain-containing protein [Acidobacteria bacterium]|nr:VWA domain-containing protein [Acidobacteriota bacterium]